MGKRSKTKQRERRTYKKRAARLKKRAINEKEPDDTSLVEPDAEATANNDVQLLRCMTSDDFPNDTVSGYHHLHRQLLPHVMSPYPYLLRPWV